MRNGSTLAGKGDAWQTDSGGFRKVHLLTECRSNIKSQTFKKEDGYSQSEKSMVQRYILVLVHDYLTSPKITYGQFGYPTHTLTHLTHTPNSHI